MKNFETISREMQLMQMPLPTHRLRIQIPDSGQVLRRTMSHFLQAENRQLQWLPEYDAVAEWLGNNHGKGLFLYGNCGRGKSLLCRYVLPAILLAHCRKVVNVFDTRQMNADIDHVLTKHLISIDDIGTEDVSMSYGNRRMAFAEITDAAEKHGKLLLISSNLSGEDIRNRYGDRVLERIKATTRRVLFEGKSLRV